VPFPNLILSTFCKLVKAKMESGLAGDGLPEQDEFYTISTDIGREHFVMALGSARDAALRRPAPRAAAQC
jgi:hypothetical protein